MSENAMNSRFILGFSLLIIGALLLTGNMQLKQKSVSASFESEPVSLSGFTAEESTETDKPTRIIIPDLEIDLVVSEAQLIDGYWEVFEDRAGWGEGSGSPGQSGNQVIFAHAQDGLFGSLEDSSIGTQIYVLTEGDWYKYQVKEIQEVYPGNTQVIKPTEDEILTLYTCSGYRDSKRLIITAERV